MVRQRTLADFFPRPQIIAKIARERLTRVKKEKGRTPGASARRAQASRQPCDHQKKLRGPATIRQKEKGRTPKRPAFFSL